METKEIMIKSLEGGVKEIKPRYHFIDTLKILAIMMVLYYHSDGVIIYIPNNPAIAKLISALISCFVAICVPMFFFIHGALLFNKAFDEKKHIKRVIKTIILTYFWSFIVVMVQLPVRWDEGVSFMGLVRNVLFFQWSNHLWFLVQMVLLYLVFPMLKLLFDGSKKIFVLFTLICLFFTYGHSLCFGSAKVLELLIGEGNILSSGLTGGFNYLNMYFNPTIRKQAWTGTAFMLGGILFFWLKKNEEKCKQRKKLINWICAIVLGFAIILSYLYNRMMEKKDYVWEGYESIFTLIICIAFFLLFFVNATGRRGKWVEVLSPCIMGIYLMHTIIQRYLNLVLYLFIDYSIIPMKLIVATLSFLITFGVVVLLRKIKFVDKILSL